MSIKLTEDIVANSLWRWRQADHRHIAAVSRSTFHQCQSDLLSIKKRETFDHEIKLSRADYFNEYKKPTKLFKHQQIENCRKTGVWNRYAPNYFFFVLPKGLLKKSDRIFSFAGVIEFEFVETTYYYDDQYHPEKKLRFTVAKQAKRIHDKQIEDKDFLRIAVALSFRLFNARAKSVGGFV